MLTSHETSERIITRIKNRVRLIVGSTTREQEIIRLVLDHHDETRRLIATPPLPDSVDTPPEGFFAGHHSS